MKKKREKKREKNGLVQQAEDPTAFRKLQYVDPVPAVQFNKKSLTEANQCKVVVSLVYDTYDMVKSESAVLLGETEKEFADYITVFDNLKITVTSCSTQRDGRKRKYGVDSLEYCFKISVISPQGIELMKCFSSKFTVVPHSKYLSNIFLNSNQK